MTEYYFMNGKMVEADKAMIPVRTHAFLYGTAVFEGIRAYWNEEEKQLYVFRAPEHYERLLRSAKIMYMKSPYTRHCINPLKKSVLGYLITKILICLFATKWAIILIHQKG